MSSFSATPPFLGPVPYYLASKECQFQAQQFTQQLLGERFSLLSREDWHHLFTKYRPLLWIDEAAQTVTVAEEVLPDLISLVGAYEATGQHMLRLLPLVEDEVYLARQLNYYCRMADRLVQADPDLTHPDSITDMRNVFFRLSGGNSVAERLSEPLLH